MAKLANLANKRIATFIACAVIVTFIGNGCSRFSFSKDANELLEKQTSKSKNHSNVPNNVTPANKLRWDGGGVIIGETDSLAFTPETFTQRVSTLIKEKRFASIDDLIRDFPDIALQSLQECEAASANDPAPQMIAMAFDKTWCRNPVWQPYLSDLSQLPDAGSQQLEIRSRFWRYLKNHQQEKALKLNLTRTLRREHGAMLRAEYYRLQSIAEMMNEDHAESIKNLESAVKLAEDDCPCLVAKLQLLLGEFYRHAGRWDEWKSTWQKAVVQASELASNDNWVDPLFWNRAAFLRPAEMEWPDTAITNLKNTLRSADLLDSTSETAMTLSSSEAVVWFTIGLQHLNRNEGQNAVLAMKKAEAVETNSATIDALRLYQAKSMSAAGQPGAASAILYRLVSDNPGKPLADRAKAILGAMKLENGSVAQGLNLIESSLESVDSWPADERMRARADYALALLIRGRESEGLRQLDLAQKQFENAGLDAQARQCMWNRARYYEKTEQKDLQQTAAQQLTDLESRLY